MCVHDKVEEIKQEQVKTRERGEEGKKARFESETERE